MTVAGEARIVAAAVRSPAAQVTVYLLNLEAGELAVSLSLHGVAADRQWFQYQVDEKALAGPGFRLRPVPLAVRTSAEVPTARVTLPARSLTALSTYRLAPEASGVVTEEGAGIPHR